MEGHRKGEEEIKRGNPWLYDETQLAMAHLTQGKILLYPGKVVIRLLHHYSRDSTKGTYSSSNVIKNIYISIITNLRNYSKTYPISDFDGRSTKCSATILTYNTHYCQYTKSPELLEFPKHVPNIYSFPSESLPSPTHSPSNFLILLSYSNFPYHFFGAKNFHKLWVIPSNNNNVDAESRAKNRRGRIERGGSQRRVWCTALITEPTGPAVADPNDVLSRN